MRDEEERRRRQPGVGDVLISSLVSRLLSPTTE